MFTIENWVFFGLLALMGFAIAVCCFLNDEPVFGLIVLLVTLVIVGGIMSFVAWYNTSTASGIRAVKDYKSNINNGIDREITITAEDGREIFHYEGKVDIESDHTDNYIKFESEEGKRYIIYYGITDTVLVREK